MKQNNINGEDDVSMYYPDGDAEHIAQDDHDDAFLNQNAKKKKKIKKRNARLTGGQTALIAVIFVIYTALIIAASWLIFYRPAGNQNDDTLPFETDPIGQESADTGIGEPPLHYGDDTSETGTDPDETDVPAETEEPVSEYIVKEDVYNILVIGHDDTALLADVVMIVNCDVKNNKISVMQIPRDTLVTIGVSTNKNNEAFSHYYMNAKWEGVDDPYTEAGARYEQMIEKSLCINIHHRVVMNLAGFQAIVDAMGGVSVNVPYDMVYEDPEQDLYINIPKGWQHLDGYNAMGFVRYREGYVQADLGRVNAQKIFITAMVNQAKAVIKNFDVSAMTGMAQAVFNSVNTNLSVSDIMYYAKFILNVDLESISMMTLPGDLSSDGYFVMNRADTLKAVNEYFNVYEKDIADNIFDRSYTFCYTGLQYLCDLYFAGSATYFGEVYSADDVNSGSIHIPHN